MKQPVLALALAAAAWLLVQPFLHWLVEWQLRPWRLAVDWVVCAIFVLLILHAAQRRRANWAAAFAAFAVAINPLWRLEAPSKVLVAIGIAGGVSLAIYAVRRWK